MDRDQIVHLLQVAQGYDSRNIDGLMVENWQRAAKIGRWTSETAAEAVHTHYALSTDWLMPAHVTRQVRANARQPAPASEVLALDAPVASPETRDRVMRMVRELAAKKGIPDE
ncbi:hypothetical protein [Tomitella gaofuii]|uniref:hypothetical protein n=1 Tax=Tomitella gaofuii TaxID=2760083 RepID=UPI0015FB8680|nr:hypothetical protein [Tomitella gaofuii]